jgi:hypothetical protein
MSNLAGLLTVEGQLPEAEKLNREAFNLPGVSSGRRIRIL